MTLFEDSFAGTSGTSLTSHTPTSIASNTPNVSLSWSAVSGKTAPLIDGSNRIYTSSTGADDYCNVAGFSFATDDYDVEVTTTFLSATGTDDTGISIYAADDNAGHNYCLKVGINSNLLVVMAKKNVTTNGVAFSGGYATIFPTGSFSANDTFTTILSVRRNLSNLANRDLSFYLIRGSDGKYLKSDGTYQTSAIAFATATDSSSVNTGGHAGIRFYEVSSPTLHKHADNFKVTSQSPALVGGVAKPSCSASAVTIYLDGTHGSTIASGGTGTITYQWHRGSTPAFTPSGGTAVGGATSSTYTPSSMTTTPEYFKCVVTDGVAATATSTETIGRLLDGAFVLASIMDSLGNTGGGVDSTILGTDLPAPGICQINNKLYSFTLFDGSKGGSGTQNWLPSGDVDYTTYGTNDPLIDWVLASNPDIILFRLGTNDFTHGTVSDYNRRIGAIFAYLIAARPAIKILLDYTPYANSAGSTYGNTHNSIVVQYQAKLDAYINNVNIFAGNRMEWVLPELISGWRNDDIHPTLLGHTYQEQGSRWALANALEGSVGSGIGGRVIGG